MSMEKSCIATSIAGTNEALTDNHNGFLVDVHAPEQIARKVIMLAYNPLLRRKLGRNARNTVTTQFDIQLLVRENEKVYLELSGSVPDSVLLTSNVSVALDNPLVTG
jgi:glycosyltransferase involved in cell wall biosynthesis